MINASTTSSTTFTINDYPFSQIDSSGWYHIKSLVWSNEYDYRKMNKETIDFLDLLSSITKENKSERIGIVKTVLAVDKTYIVERKEDHSIKWNAYKATDMLTPTTSCSLYAIRYNFMDEITKLIIAHLLKNVNFSSELKQRFFSNFLFTALREKNDKIVKHLLDIFPEFDVSALASLEISLQWEKTKFQRVSSPLFVALTLEDPLSAEQLLLHGADPRKPYSSKNNNANIITDLSRIVRLNLNPTDIVKRVVKKIDKTEISKKVELVKHVLNAKDEFMKDKQSFSIEKQLKSAWKLNSSFMFDYIKTQIMICQKKGIADKDFYNFYTECVNFIEKKILNKDQNNRLAEIKSQLSALEKKLGISTTVSKNIDFSLDTSLKATELRKYLKAADTAYQEDKLEQMKSAISSAASKDAVCVIKYLRTSILETLQELKNTKQQVNNNHYQLLQFISFFRQEINNKQELLLLFNEQIMAHFNKPDSLLKSLFKDEVEFVNFCKGDEVKFSIHSSSDRSYLPLTPVTPSPHVTEDTLAATLSIKIKNLESLIASSPSYSHAESIKTLIAKLKDLKETDAAYWENKCNQCIEMIGDFLKQISSSSSIVGEEPSIWSSGFWMSTPGPIDYATLQLQKNLIELQALLKGNLVPKMGMKKTSL